MNYGLCLTGGGAKGAYQAGIIKALKEKNYNIKVITGTSIGAINGYFIYKDAYEKMYKFWFNMHMDKYFDSLNMVVENRRVIDELSIIEGLNKNIDKFYVNYVEVEDKCLKEVVVNITDLDKNDGLAAIKASSLLPFNYEGDLQNVSAKILFEQFKIDVNQGKYDGYKLDGGILNNCLLQPFIENKVDKIIISSLSNEFEVPEYIYESYKKEDIIVLNPNFDIKPQDTVNFTNEFCTTIFNLGYRYGKELL